MKRALRISLMLVVFVLAACDSTSETTTGAAAELPPATTPSTPTSSVPEPPVSTTLVEVPDETATTQVTRPPTPRRSPSDCHTSPGALQAVLDAAPDGQRIADMWGKLINAESLGFTVLDLSRECFENQGTVTLDGRNGLWIVRPTTSGTDWVLINTGDTVISGLSFGDGSLTIIGGNQRVEAGQVHDLSVSGSTDFMMGKMVITGHTIFEDMTRADIGGSFARNSEFNTVEVTGVMNGFKILSSSATSLADETEPGSDLNLIDLVIQ